MKLIIYFDVMYIPNSSHSEVLRLSNFSPSLVFVKCNLYYFVLIQCIGLVRSAITVYLMLLASSRAVMLYIVGTISQDVGALPLSHKLLISFTVCSMLNSYWS